MRRGISLLLDKHIFEDHIYDIDDVKNVILEIKNYLQINTFVLIPYYNKKILSSLIFALVCGKEIYVKFEKIETLKEMLGKTRRKNALDFTDFMNFFEWQRGDIKVSKKIRLEKIKLKYKEQVLGYLFISLNAIARNKLKEKKCVDLFEQLKIIIKLSLQTKASNDDGIKNKINEKIENYFKKNDFSKDAISLGRIEKKYFSTVLKMAMQLTKSKAGSIYLFDKIKTVLRRKVYVGEKKPPEVFKQYREKTNIIQYVFYNSKKLFLSNNLSELSKRYPNIKYYSAFKNSSIRNIKEFAYPLQFKSGEKEIIFGVLNLEKNDGTNFTSQDLRLVEILSEQCGSVFNYFIQNMSLRMIINKIVENLSCEGAPEGSSDMETTKDIIDLVVLNAFKCTPAHSVTVRYVDKDERKLLRFCVKSVFKTDLNKNQLPISLKNYRESCNAWACVNGKECYINNVYKKDEFKKYKELKSSWKVREETIAEFCLPIVVQGRVIGTMNLESIYRAGFDYSIDYLRTLVKLLELSISLNRYKIEETAFKSRTILLYSLHDLKNKIRDLWKKNRFSLKKSNKNNNVFIDNLLDLIDSVESYEMRQDNEKGKEKILSIVSQVIKDLEIENVSIIRENDLFVKTEYITSLKMALNNIFDNCRLAAMGSTIYIKGRQSIFKNKKSLNLLIEHQGTSDLKEEEIDKLYYRPFLRKGKIRLGAFTAGVLLRSIGGNVYMSRHIYESPVIRIIVAIPVE